MCICVRAPLSAIEITDELMTTNVNFPPKPSVLPPTSGDGAEKSQGSLFKSLVRSPLIWGGLITFGFYAGIPHLPMYRELATRYFCSHPLEYVTTTLFFIGMAILALKYLDLMAENAIWQTDFIRQAGSLKQEDPQETADHILFGVDYLPPALGLTVLAQRFRDVGRYVKGRLSTEGLEEHLKYLAELAAERQHSSFAFVRTITWAVPILGFLGTVMGITLAIANVTPEQLESSLGEVTGGLAVAFDTTALALGLSLVLVFSSFLTERSERSILDRVEEFGIKTLINLFPSLASAPAHPLMQAETEAAAQLITQTESLIQWQTEHWRQSLDELRERWLQTLAAQQTDMESTLAAGMQETLKQHQQSLEDVRNEFLQTIQQLTAKLTESVQQSHELSTRQIQEIQQLANQLQQIGSNEETLLRLQGQLTQNLEALQVAETFEETMHSLSAAVHLLSTRAKQPSKAA